MRLFLLALLLTTASVGETPSDLQRIYAERYASRLESMLCQAIQFRTVAGNTAAFVQQGNWLRDQARQLGLVHRDAGPVKEIELPGPAGAPVLGLVVHGDVQPAGDSGWTTPPFECAVRNGYVYGRGVADDKGPLVQALLALASLRWDARARTHTVRLLVGSDEESDNKDFATYLKTHSPPDVTLVLDSLFPVVVGEKAWNALELTVADPYRSREAARAPWTLVELDAGVAPSIVPPRAVARLRWSDLTGFDAALEALCPTVMPDGFDCDAGGTADDAVLTVTGRAAHSGMNLEGGRNALVFLADALHGKVKPCGAADLLDFAAMAGKDTRGGGLGLDREDPLWGSYGVNVAMLKPLERGKLRLTINLRRIPPMTNDQIRSHLAARVSKYSDERRTAIETGGFFDDEPFAVPPEARLVRRLLAAYQRSTGEKARPAITGGGTYAKRLPNAIAFGMWFPGQPYSGHDVDERIAIADLHRGVAVLLEALNDLAYSAPIAEPLLP